MSDIKELNDNVKSWWDHNPYAYGLSTSPGDYRDVGDIQNENLDGQFFEIYMRKARKHFDDAQRPDQRIAVRFIDYERLNGKRVLDIACGLGWASVEMAAAGGMVTGIDLTPRAVEVAKRHAEYRSLDIDFRVMDAQALEFPDNSFDFVHAWGCLMHMPDTNKAISEIYRVLKPQGWTSGYMYNKSSISYWWNMWFLRGILGGKLRIYPTSTALASRYADGVRLGGNAHTKVNTPTEANTLFANAQFKNVQVNPWGPPEMLHYFPILKLPLGRYLPYNVRKAITSRWGWGMIFSAEK